MSKRKRPKELARKWKRKMISLREPQASEGALTPKQKAAVRKALTQFLQEEMDVRETTEASQ